jgi:hypothetical protein
MTANPSAHLQAVSRVRRCSVEIPAKIENALNDDVARHLRDELGSRDLLLSDDELQQAAAEAAEDGERLLVRALEHCYPMLRSGDCVVEFQSDSSGGRLKAALVFGAVTARLLAPGKRGLGPTRGQMELLCGVFNLGIGLIDGLCDHDTEVGLLLVEILARLNLPLIAEVPRERGWLRGALAQPLGHSHEAAFAADVVETFFDLLHTLCPGEQALRYRRTIGELLSGALDAEMQSVSDAVEDGRGHASIQCSRLTSVMPFQTIETLARGPAQLDGEPKAGVLLGEAIWRIDDLIDLCSDARCGALNSVLLEAQGETEGRDGQHPSIAALEHLLKSPQIARTAKDACDSLLAGLREARGGRAVGARAGDDQSARAFLLFVQRYAGLVPHNLS